MALSTYTVAKVLTDHLQKFILRVQNELQKWQSKGMGEWYFHSNDKNKFKHLQPPPPRLHQMKYNICCIRAKFDDDNLLKRCLRIFGIIVNIKVIVYLQSYFQRYISAFISSSCHENVIKWPSLHLQFQVCKWSVVLCNIIDCLQHWNEKVKLIWIFQYFESYNILFWSWTRVVLLYTRDFAFAIEWILFCTIVDVHLLNATSTFILFKRNSTINTDVS